MRLDNRAQKVMVMGIGTPREEEEEHSLLSQILHLWLFLVVVVEVLLLAVW